MGKYPPHKFPYSFKAFKRYEPVFYRVLTVHGKKILPAETITFKLPGAPSSHKNGISDAVRSLKENKWQSELDLERLIELWPSLTVDTDFSNKQCIIRVKANIHSSEIASLRSEDLISTNPSELEFRAILVILNYQTFKDLTIRVVDLSESLVKQTPAFRKEFPNVVFDYPDSNNLSNIYLL